MGANGPDKPEQFARDSHYGLVLVLAFGRQRLVALVQSVLRLPGYGLHILVQSPKKSHDRLSKCRG